MLKAAILLGLLLNASLGIHFSTIFRFFSNSTLKTAILWGRLEWAKLSKGTDFSRLAILAEADWKAHRVPKCWSRQSIIVVSDAEGRLHWASTHGWGGLTHKPPSHSDPSSPSAQIICISRSDRTQKRVSSRIESTSKRTNATRTATMDMSSSRHRPRLSPLLTASVRVWSAAPSLVILGLLVMAGGEWAWVNITCWLDTHQMRIFRPRRRIHNCKK